MKILGLREDRVCRRCGEGYNARVKDRSKICPPCGQKQYLAVGRKPVLETKRPRRDERKCITCKQRKNQTEFEIPGPIYWLGAICRSCRVADRRLKVPLHYKRAVIDSQGGRCKVCHIHESQQDKALALDHCHITGIVRGALCNSCNWGLGHFRDRADLLRLAALYLDSFS